MKYIDYYETLGISKTASEKEIKQSYRKLARQHHPDLHQGDAKATAEEKFKLINEAYEVLGDPEKRAKYDQLGMNWKMGDESHFDPSYTDSSHNYTYQGVNDADLNGFGFSNFFSSIFGQDFNHSQYGGGRTRKANYKGEDVETEISLSVDELIHGVEKDLYLSAPSVCIACEGQRFNQRGVCQSCSGTGVTEDTKTVKVKVPAGLYPGASLRLKGLGGKGYGDGPTGDLYLHIRVASTSAWQINDSDLETDLTLRPEQAVLGDKISVPTPHGLVQLKVAPGTHAGQRLRLRNKGLPKKQGSGDLYLKIRIDIPQDLSEAEKDLYRKLREFNTFTVHKDEPQIA
jgi:curved DNA-binding protein